eukprot:3812086-Amphidinium_carterae.1
MVVAAVIKDKLYEGSSTEWWQTRLSQAPSGSSRATSKWARSNLSEMAENWADEAPAASKKLLWALLPFDALDTALDYCMPVSLLTGVTKHE